MTHGRAFGTAAAVFAIGVIAAVLAMNQYDEAYKWVAHTSDVRLVIGRTVGHAAHAMSCLELRGDVDELTTLIADNAAQQGQLASLHPSLDLVCSNQPAPQLIAQLSDLDAAERGLMAVRRERLSATRTLTILAFVGSMLAALGIVLIARWLQQRAMRAVVESEERFRMLAASASDLIRIHDAKGQTFYASPSSLRLLGYTPEEMVAMAPIQLGHPEDLAAMKATLTDLQVRHAPASILRYRLRTKAGEYRWFETHTDPVRDRAGNLLQFYTSARDVTEQVETQQQLEKLSITDELTGLHNRRGFMLLGTQEHLIAVRQKLGLAVVFADLDGLKAINDTLGHELGDRAIRQLADILRETFRESDVVARLGGDEFAVLAYDVDRARLEPMLERIRSAVEASRRDAAQPFQLAVSLGVSLLEPGERRSLDDLVAEADGKMYELKRARKATRASRKSASPV